MLEGGGTGHRCTVPNCMVAMAQGVLHMPKDFFQQWTWCYALLWSNRQLGK